MALKILGYILLLIIGAILVEWASWLRIDIPMWISKIKDKHRLKQRNKMTTMNRLEQQIEVLKDMLQKTESHTEAMALAYGINALQLVNEQTGVDADEILCNLHRL